MVEDRTRWRHGSRVKPGMTRGGGLLKSFVVVAVAVMAALLPAEHATATDPANGPALLVDQATIDAILRHGPWPMTAAPDPTNRFSGNTAAIQLGERLFFDKDLARDGKTSCASCHARDLGWTDGRDRAVGISRLDRNTQTLFNVRFQRWFGWDGRNDSLWGHSLGPLLDPREMGGDPEFVARRIAAVPEFARLYTEMAGRAPNAAPAEDVMVDAAKAMAAFQETLVTGKTPFDRFRDALAAGDRATAAEYPTAAQRGAMLFFGPGNCAVCHTGPLFTNGEFADVAIPYFTGPGRVDPGRHGGIQKLKASPFNRLGRHSDATDPAVSWATRHVANNHQTFGQFKVPSLRELTRTAPYMHNGSVPTLQAVVEHYADINMERLHTDGEAILAPMDLSDRQKADLVAFLESLSVE